MINEITEILKPVFLEMDLSNYLRVSYSDKADLQINSVFQIAKDMCKNPIQIGEEIVRTINEIVNFKDYFKEVQFVKPGFINIFYSDKFINQYIREEKYIDSSNKNEVYFLDYGGPNIAKPLHIGHLRPAIIGESFKRILEYKGYKTIGDVHLGDYGLQIGQVIYGILSDNKNKDDIDIDYLNYIYPKMSALCKENEEVYEKCKKITYDFQHGQYKDLYAKIKEVSLSDIKRLYNYLDVVGFDLWLGESDCEPFIPGLMKVLEDKNLLYLDNGAKIVNVKRDDDNKEMPPCMILSSDGTYMYATSDLAAILDRVNTYKPNYILYFTDARQSLHFEQVFRVAQMSGICNGTKLEHLPFGTINGSDGKPFKTRSGGTLKLDELIKEVRESFISKREENKNMSESDIDKITNAIIKFADLQNNREKSYNFDINKFSDVSGKTGPYILYSALRIKRIIDSNKVSAYLSDNIYNEVDRSLRVKLMELDKYLTKAIDDKLPSYVAEYVYDLCNLVNSFYENINISKLDDENTKNDYIFILSKVYKVIEDCLNMLIIDIPSHM